MKSGQEKIQWITRTGVLIALVIGVQWATEWTSSFAGQFITESCVNCVLVASALLTGMWSGVTIAVLSPFCAFVLGLGPRVFQVVPAIALGNFVLVLLAVFTLGRKEMKLPEKMLTVAAMSAVKFVVLYCAVILVLIPAMGPYLSFEQATAFRSMFFWPQLVTALIGTTLAVLLVPVLKRHSKH